MTIEIALIACSKGKAVRPPYTAVAGKMYTGQLHQAQLAYARHVLSLPARQIYILSARYGLVALDTRIQAYDQTLATFSKTEREAWGRRVLADLQNQVNLQQMTIYLLAGKVYREPLSALPAIVPHPPALGYARQVAWYRNQVAQHA